MPGVISAVATGFSAFQGFQAGQQQRKQAALEAGQSQIQLQRQRIQAVRQARIKQAQVIAMSAQAGAGVSSTSQGQQAGIISGTSAESAGLSSEGQIQGQYWQSRQAEMSAQGWQQVGQFVSTQAGDIADRRARAKAAVAAVNAPRV